MNKDVLLSLLHDAKYHVENGIRYSDNTDSEKGIEVLDNIISLLKKENEQNLIQSIEDWFKEAKPNPTNKDIMVQIGCHYEEIGEMATALADNEEDCVCLDTESLSDLYKTAYAQRADWIIKYFDKKELLDSLCDQIVTAIGVAYMMGFDLQGALTEVNNSNWSKFENGKAIFDENGKIKKGKNYFKPDLERFL